jgi:hypothetical protein
MLRTFALAASLLVLISGSHIRHRAALRAVRPGRTGAPATGGLPARATARAVTRGSTTSGIPSTT